MNYHYEVGIDYTFIISCIYIPFHAVIILDICVTGFSWQGPYVLSCATYSDQTYIRHIAYWYFTFSHNYMTATLDTGFREIGRGREGMGRGWNNMTTHACTCSSYVGLYPQPSS